MHNVYLAVPAAAVAAWIFGAVWYGVLGKAWTRAQGIDPDSCKDKKMPLWPMLGSFGAELLMALALRHVLARLELFRWNEGLFTGLMIGVFFVATTILVNNLFQGRKLMLTLIDGLHWIFVLAIEGLVLALLG
jgi:hypothetical protein